MAIEQVNGAVVITGERDIRLVQLTVWRSALKLEMRGMHRRGRSVYSIVKGELGFKGNKQRVYDQLCDYIKEKEAERAADTVPTSGTE